MSCKTISIVPCKLTGAIKSRAILPPQTITTLSSICRRLNQSRSTTIITTTTLSISHILLTQWFSRSIPTSAGKAAAQVPALDEAIGVGAQGVGWFPISPLSIILSTRGLMKGKQSIMSTTKQPLVDQLMLLTIGTMSMALLLLRLLR